MVVIFILFVLAGLMVPLVSGFINVIHVQRSQATVNLLDTACRLYQKDFQEFVNSGPANRMGPSGTYLDSNGTRWSSSPPSHFPELNASGGEPSPMLYGCQFLVQALTGYAPDVGGGAKFDQPDSIPTSLKQAGPGAQFLIYEDDGCQGFGFRMSVGSRVYGPYNGAEKLKVSGTNLSFVPYNEVNSPTYDIYTIKDTGGTPRPVFLDSFGSPILYYRADPNTGAYRFGGANGVDQDNNTVWKGGDNPCQFAVMKVQSLNGDGTSYSTYYTINEPVMQVPPSDYVTDPSGKYCRDDFMLMSWGGDKRWYMPMSPKGLTPKGANYDLTVYSTKKDDANNFYGK